MSPNIRTAQLLTLVAIFFYSANSKAETTNIQPIAVEVKFQKGKASYEIESRQVRSEFLLDVLGEILRLKGRNTRVVVIVDSRHAITTLDGIRGTVGKVGFLNAHYFVLSSETQRMAEITFDHPAVPYSLNPDTTAQRKTSHR